MRKNILLILFSSIIFNTLSALDKSVKTVKQVKLVRPNDISLNKKLKFSFKARKGVTFLHVAAKMGNKDLAQLLIQRGSNVNAMNSKNMTPLHCVALFSRSFELAKLLIKSGADVNIKCADGYTALHILAWSLSSVEIARLLIASGADFNITDDWGWYPLHSACCRGNIDVATLLISSGANVNALCNVGETALHKAVNELGCKQSIVELLLFSGVNKNIKNFNNQTAADIAKNPAIKEFLNNCSLINFR